MSPEFNTEFGLYPEVRDYCQMLYKDRREEF